jgi:hypothetical protein
MPNYMLFLHQDLERPRPATPDDFMPMIKEYAAWADKMRTEGHMKGGEKLADDAGKVIRHKGGRVTVTDGPYAESKELVGGYFVLSAKDYDEVCQLAESCPHLKFGGRIEIRQIEGMANG